MPVDGLDGSPMIHDAGEIEQESHNHHASMEMGADHDEHYCADNQSACCLIMLLVLEKAVPATNFFREVFYASRSVNQPIIRLESLYKPPKFYLASAG